MTDAIKILPVPRQMIGAVWPHAAPHLLKGLTAATDTSLRQVVDGLVSGEDVLWVVIEANATTGAFLTSNYEDEASGETFVGVYALGGYGLARWAKLLDEAMTGHALRTGATSVRFVGREAWSRVLPAFTAIGRVGDEAIYRRAVA